MERVKCATFPIARPKSVDFGMKNLVFVAFHPITSPNCFCSLKYGFEDVCIKVATIYRLLFLLLLFIFYQKGDLYSWKVVLHSRAPFGVVIDPAISNIPYLRLHIYTIENNTGSHRVLLRHFLKTKKGKEFDDRVS